MQGQFLNSLFGMQSTKELSTTGILKTNNSALQSNNGENSFIAKLANSMKNTSTTDDQDSAFKLSELDNISDIEDINNFMEIASMGIPTNIPGNQIPLNQVLNHDIPVETFTNGNINSITNVKASSVQIKSNTLLDNVLINNQGSDALKESNINLIKITQEVAKDSYRGLPVASLADNLNRSQSSTKTNEQNVAGILNKLNPAKIVDTTGKDPLFQSSTISGKQIAESHKGLNTNQLNVQLDTNKNIGQVQTPALSVNNSSANLNIQSSTKTNEQNVAGILNKLTPAKIADTTGKDPLFQSSTIPGKQIAESHKGLNTNQLNVQLDTNKNISQVQTPALSVNNSSANLNNQSSAKTNEQNVADILNKLNPSKIAETTGKDPLFQSSTIPGKQIAESHKGSNTNPLNVQLDTNKNINQVQTPVPSLNNLNANKLDPASTIEKISSNLTLQASGSSNNKITNPDALLIPKEGAINKIHEILKEQYPDNAVIVNPGRNSFSQHSSTQTQADSNESPKILDIRPNFAEATASKSSDDTISINNYSINGADTDEAVLQVRTSSDNSSFNNQGKETLDEFYINSVNAKQKTSPQTNFINTLSQINNSTQPFESLGSDTADNIVQKAKLFMEGGKAEVKLLLNPPELGTLKLEFAIEDDNNLEAKITVERSAVKEVIEKDIPRLRELISNADIDVGKLDVSLQEKEEEKLSLMDKNLQSGSEGDSTQDIPDQENEFLNDGTDEESIEYDEDSNKINFLV